MAHPQQIRKVGAHSNQETRPRDSSSQRPTVAPDSQQPPTGRKRKFRTLSPEQLGYQQVHHQKQAKRRRILDSSWDRAERFYWDSLSRLWLAADALRELDRRNALLAEESPQEVRKLEHQILPRDIEHFARHGGPDLSDLRQYSNSSGASTVSESMPLRGGRKSSEQKSSDDTEKTRRSSAYTPNFAQKLVDNRVSLLHRSHRPANHQEWSEVLEQPRPSLSPSRMSDGHYDRFINAIDEAANEEEVMSHVFPMIVGDRRYPSRQNAKLVNLDPLVDDIVVPQPDYYEGELPGPGNRRLRQQLDTSIVPSSHKHYPFLPNLFAEAKGPAGSLLVAQRQACHDGALGARATHRVENLGRREEVFDNKARTASVIYHGAGNLAFHTHHLAQPEGRGTPSQTHMTQIGSFDLQHGPKGFRQGVGAFRNASDYAHQLRKESIENAHRRNGIDTPEPPTSAPRSTRKPLACQTAVVESGDSDSSSSSEEDGDDGNYGESSRAPPKGKLLKPKIVSFAPKRLAGRSPSPRPMIRQREAIDPDPRSSLEEESSKAPQRRQHSKTRVLTATPKRLARRESSPPRRELRPRKGSRRL
ncbi:MAG: hypothetical protein ALECFALPRED_011076 [Alectoria fallacina]|uniref:DUF7924 domain-containing protein n=1 Tax=Alectoria fallacina TaxID=1903189 RepID=A0A8H3PKJ3_9LECA|nr:MAG: hypothetical protein ALECFALPRED_011076 [Alectoria fallacina]